MTETGAAVRSTRRLKWSVFSTSWHLKYLAPMISGSVVEYVIARSLQADCEPREVIADIGRPS